MKIIGISNTSIQKVFYYLKGKVTIGFMEDDSGDCEVLIVPSLQYYRKHGFSFLKSGRRCKVLLILDFVENLKLIKGCQIIKQVSDQFVEYIKTKTHYGIPVVKKEKNRYIYDILENYQTSIFQREIQPILYKGILNKQDRDKIRRVIVKDIFSRIKKNFQPNILAYKDDINPRRLEHFLEWLKTDESREFCCQLIKKEKGKLLDSFEVSYLHSVLNSGD